MFDKYYTKGTEHIPYTKTINIGRAPTDESIKLYEEIKEKAFKSILDSMNISGNTVNVNAILYQDDSSFQRVLRYKYILNGDESEGKIFCDDSITKCKDSMEQICKSLANKIAVEILIKIRERKG